MPTDDDTLTTAAAAAILGIIRTSAPRVLREHGIEPRGREPPPGRGFLWPKTAVEELARTYDNSRRARRINPRWIAPLFPEARPRPALTAEEWAKVVELARQRVQQRRSYGTKETS